MEAKHIVAGSRFRAGGRELKPLPGLDPKENVALWHQHASSSTSAKVLDLTPRTTASLASTHRWLGKILI